MPPLAALGFQIYLRSRVTLIFYLLTLTPKVSSFTPLSVYQLCELASKLVHSFSKYRVQSLVTDELTDGLTDGRTNGQVENIMPPPVSLMTWQKHKTVSTLRYLEWLIIRSVVEI